MTQKLKVFSVFFFSFAILAIYSLVNLPQKTFGSIKEMPIEKLASQGENCTGNSCTRG